MKSISIRIAATASLLLAVALTGCVKYEQKTQVNPDQSGKALIKFEVASPMLLFGDKIREAGLKPKDLAEEMAKRILGAANGVEAWSDVEYGVGPAGKTKFSAVAYFSDLKEFATAGSGGANKMPEIGEWKSEMVEGKWVIQMDLKMEDLGKKKGDPVPADQIDAKIEEQRAEWKQMKGTMGIFLSEVEMDFSLEVGGTMESVQNLELKKDSVASLNLSGRKILNGLETLVMDDDFMKNAMIEGNVDRRGKVIPDGDMIGEILLGGDGPAKIVITPGEPLFDYEKEVAEAKAAMSDDLKKLIEEGKALMGKTDG